MEIILWIYNLVRQIFKTKKKFKENKKREKNYHLQQQQKKKQLQFSD